MHHESPLYRQCLNFIWIGTLKCIEENGFSAINVFFLNRSLKDCIPTILEVLVSLIGDEYSHVALYSRKVLELFSSTHLGHECRPLVEMLEENLHQLTVSLPRLIRSSGMLCHLKDIVVKISDFPTVFWEWMEGPCNCEYVF